MSLIRCTLCNSFEFTSLRGLLRHRVQCKRYQEKKRKRLEETQQMVPELIVDIVVNQALPQRDVNAVNHMNVEAVGAHVYVVNEVEENLQEAEENPQEEEENPHEEEEDPQEEEEEEEEDQPLYDFPNAEVKYNMENDFGGRDTKYLDLQEKFAIEVYGNSMALNASDLIQYKSQCFESMSEADMKKMIAEAKLKEFHSMYPLTDQGGDTILKEVLPAFGAIVDLDTTCWKTIRRRDDKATKFYNILTCDMPWPPSWNMDQWIYGTTLDAISVTAVNPLDQLAIQLIGP
jgi:hypothetical protein